MKILIILIMCMAAIMLLLYFVAMITRHKKLYIAFRVALLCLILFLTISWIVSIVLGQHYFVLLPMIIIFIVLYIES